METAVGSSPSKTKDNTGADGPVIFTIVCGCGGGFTESGNVEVVGLGIRYC